MEKEKLKKKLEEANIDLEVEEITSNFIKYRVKINGKILEPLGLSESILRSELESAIGGEPE